MADSLGNPGQPPHPEILVEQPPFEAEQTLRQQHFSLKCGFVAGGSFKGHVIVVEKIGGSPEPVKKIVALQQSVAGLVRRGLERILSIA